MSVRTDLALEAATLSPGGTPAGVSIFEDKTYDKVKVTRVTIESEEGQRAIGKPPGIYITVEAPGLTGTDADIASETARAFAKELGMLISDKVDKKRPALVVGLGNRAVTPDSIGPRVVQKVFVTRHMFNLIPDQMDQRANCVCAIAPGVLGDTGIESGEVISSLVKALQPSIVIAVDALASASAHRVATTVQLADSGISPGAGIGNKRPRLDEQSLGVPVYAVGVPTVVHAATLAIEAASDALQQTHENEAVINRVNNLLRNSCGDMIVTPKDIDQIADECANTIANALNMALHPGMTLDEIVHWLQ